MTLVNEVHAWDMGIVHAWWHTQPKDVGERFAKHVAESSNGYTVAALDCEGPTWRHALYPAYKANREDKPEKVLIKEQIRVAANALRRLGIKAVCVDTFEADDLLATVARRAVASGKYDRVVLHTNDKDMCQLLSGRVQIHNTRGWVGVNDVVTRFGVLPVQLGDWLAIAGDSSDNIPGAKGLGPVAAKTILQTHQTLDAALQAARHEASILEPKLRNKQLQKLLSCEQDVLLARRLVALDDCVPIGGR